jgi:hypothetical protein
MPISKWWGLEEVRELRAFFALLSGLLNVLLMLCFGYNLFKATMLSIAFDFLCNSIISLISTISERRYRIKQEAFDGFKKTLNRLALNKTRKYRGRQTSFEN